MATHGLWFWLLINLGHDFEFRSRVSKRSIDNTGECPTQEHRNRNSFLWVMERSPPVYFFGTIHVPYTKVWDYIPLNSKHAFYETQNIYFELDLTDSVTLTTLARCQILPNGVMLREVTPRTLYKRIRRHLSYIRRMMPVWMTQDQRMMGLSPLDLYKALTRNWYKKRPIWIMLLLNALTEYDTKGRGTYVLDTFLIREAVSRHKTTGSIESVEEQCEPLNALNNSQVMIALNQTLVLHEKIRRGEAKLTYSTKDLIYHYNCGDLTDILFKQDMSSLANIENTSLSNSFEIEQARRFEEYLKEELIYKRNRRMSKRVVQLIQNDPMESFFFAFGAGHFLGNGSIIDILQKQGYNVSHVHPDAFLRRYGPKRTIKNSWKSRQRKRRRKGRRKHHRKRMQRLKMNIDNLWKRDPFWKTNVWNRDITPGSVFPSTTAKQSRAVASLTLLPKQSGTRTSLSSSLHISHVAQLLWINILIFSLTL